MKDMQSYRRMNRIKFVLLLSVVSLIAGFSVNAQDFIPPRETEELDRLPWTQKPFLNNSDHFQFAVVTDRTGGHRDGIFEEAVQKLNMMQPEFVMSVGDLVEGYFDNADQSDREWTQFNSLVDDLDMRFFYVPGNHDIWSPFGRKAWEDRFGTSYYHFVYKNVLFLAINSEDGRSTTMGPDQIQYFLDVLEQHKDVTWTLVFLHKPMWYYEETGDRETGWQPIEDALKDRKHTVFAGHRHRYISFNRNDTRYIQLATTGGGSELTGPIHGRFDHFVWITMTPEGPILANLLLDGILDADISNEQSNAIINNLSRSFEVSLNPIHTNPGDVYQWQTELTVRNKADIPMEFSGGFQEDDVFAPIPSTFTTMVEPNGEWRKTIAFERMSHWPMTSDKILPFHYNVVHHPEAVPGPVLWEQTIFAAAEAPRAIPTLDHTITIDGQSGDWDRFDWIMEDPLAMSGAKNLWSGPEDLSYAFSLRTDDKHLYIGIEVQDDHVIDKGAVRTGSQDYFQFTIDARPQNTWGDRSSGDDWYQEPLGFFASASNGTDANQVFGPDEVEVNGMGRINDDGYFFECAIAHASLDKCAGGTWKDLRINFAVTDVDVHTGSRTTLWWRPSWTSSASYSKSGHFVRSE